MTGHPYIAKREDFKATTEWLEDYLWRMGEWGLSAQVWRMCWPQFTSLYLAGAVPQPVIDGIVEALAASRDVCAIDKFRRRICDHPDLWPLVGN